MRRNLSFAIAFAIGVLAVAMVIGNRRAPVVHAQSSGCDATSFSGAYGYSLQGNAWDSQGNLYFFGAAGRVVSDGNGNLTGTDTFSFDGTISKRQYTGTYTMNADCTGSLTFAVPNGATTHADFVAVTNGKELNLVQTDSGFILTGVLKQQQSQ